MRQQIERGKREAAECEKRDVDRVDGGLPAYEPQGLVAREADERQGGTIAGWCCVLVLETPI
jgi:hypothetical protein